MGGNVSTNSKFYGVLTICWFLIGCTNSYDNEKQLISINKHAFLEDKNLIAKLNITDSTVAKEDDIIISVSIVNKSSNDFALPEEQVLKNAILSLNVFNINGDTLRTLPPVTPSSDSSSSYKKVLKPNEKYNFEYIGLGLFNPPLAKGEYRVAMRFIASNSVWFEVE